MLLAFFLRLLQGSAALAPEEADAATGAAPDLSTPRCSNEILKSSRPFDVAESSDIFDKRSLLIIDMDSVMMECCVAQRLYISKEQRDRAAGTVGRPPTGAKPSAPSLQQLLDIFLSQLRSLMVTNNFSVEFVQGTFCRDLRSVLSGTTNPSTRSSSVPDSFDLVEEVVWLQAYQSILRFAAEKKVKSSVSFYVVKGPAWCGAVERLRRAQESPFGRNHQLFPVICSSDNRAFFCSSSIDVLLTLWPYLCRSEVTQVFGELPGPTSSIEVDRVADALNGVPLYLSCPMKIRQRLGLMSVVDLSAFYALLVSSEIVAAECHDGTAQPVLSNGESREMPAVDRVPSVDTGGGAGKSRTMLAVLHSAVATVNSCNGIFTIDTVDRWRRLLASTLDSNSYTPAEPCLLGLLGEIHSAQSSVTQTQMSVFILVPILQDSIMQYVGPPPLPFLLERCFANASDTVPHFFVAGRCDGENCDAQDSVPERLVALVCSPLRRIILRCCDVLSSGAGVEKSPLHSSVESSKYTLAHTGIYVTPCPMSISGDNPCDAMTEACGRRELPKILNEAPVKLPVASCLLIDEIEKRMEDAVQLPLLSLSILHRSGIVNITRCVPLFLHFLLFLRPSLQRGEPTLLAPSQTSAGSAGETRGMSMVDAADIKAWVHATAYISLLQAFTTSCKGDHSLKEEDILRNCLTSSQYGTLDGPGLLSYLQQRGLLLSGRRGFNKGESAILHSKHIHNTLTSTQWPSGVWTNREMDDCLQKLFVTFDCPASIRDEMTNVCYILTMAEGMRQSER